MPQLVSFAELLTRSAERYGDDVFLPRHHGRGGDPVTFGALHDDVRRIGAGLLGRGIGKGAHVGLVAENRYEWILCDQACAYIGAVDVPRGTDTPARELRFLLGHAGCRFAFVETAAVARELGAQRDGLPELRTLCVTCEPAPTIEGLEVIDLATLRAEGERALAADPGPLDAAAAAVGRDDLLTTIYTSGTTASPKGVMLTHGNVLANIEMLEEVLHFDHEDVALSVLPAWHAYERIMDYVLLYAGSKLVYSDRRRLKEDLQAVKPTIFIGVPRIWEMLYDGLVASARKLKGIRRKLLVSSLETCRRVGCGGPRLRDRVLHAVLRRTLLPELVNRATGGRLRLAVSGGGALPAHVDECLIGVGIPLLNGYGLTETSPVISVRLPERNRPHTIGPLLPQTHSEIRSPEGEVLPAGETGILWVSGPQIMRGYYANDELTREVLRDGWFNTGDLARVEPNGELRITGRAKDTIVLAGGENVEPEHIETALKTSPFIDQAVVVGQDQKTLGAILVANVECLEQELPRTEWAECDGLLSSDAVKRLFRTDIDQILTRDAGFRPFERVATFRILTEPLTVENGFLTQTLKVKRHVVHERYGDLIDAMFRG